MKTEAERQLAKLVAMPTITGDVMANDMALDYIQNYLATRGMYCTRGWFKEHGTLLASTLPGNLLTPTVLLTAHIDVVTGGEELFALRQQGDKLFGRGVYDMKFSIAGYLQVVDELQESLGDYDFGVMITSDEEAGSDGARGLVAAGLRPEVCIMPDSTAPGWDIETVAKGIWRFDLVARGRTAHGGRPWEGESASLKLIHALHELKTHFDGQNVSSDSINIGKISGGHSYNIVPAEMVAAVEIRYISKEHLKHNRDMIRKLCTKHGLALKQGPLSSSVATDLGHPLVNSYQQSVETITGRRPEGVISCAGSDAPPFYNVGINCILSCPVGGGHHTEGEWISRKSFSQFVPILLDYLKKTAKKNESKAPSLVHGFSR